MDGIEKQYRSLGRGVLAKALLSRFVEEALLALFSEGKLNGTVHTCIGEEASGAIVTEFLQPGDTIFSNHRCHGHFISHSDDVEGLIAELMGRTTGVCGGLGGSQHLYQNGFFSNGIQGGIVPVAAGLALGHKIQGHGKISAVFIGDGTLGEGVVYEAMNIASKWELPLLIVVEDNKYSQSTSQPETLAGTLEGRAAAFGIPFAKGDTWNWQGLAGEAGRMIERIRQDSRPGMLQIETFRLKAHSKGDDTRPREAIEPFEKMDPINLVLGELSAEEEPWVLGLKQRISEAIGKAEREPLAVLPDMRPATGPVTWSEARRTERQRVVVALNETLHQLMGEHEGIFLLGEDVLAPYGGAFKVTKGLSDAFPGRVKNTPISEGCITGMGVGLGLLPFYPIVEIMFGDFIGLAFDQIVNHAAKFKQMYNGQIDTNVIVRTPMGGGRGYGPTHSQTLDRHFLGVPGLRVLALNHLIHPGQLYRPLIVPGSGPTLVIENKLLYGEFIQSEAPEGYAVLHSSQTFPSVWVRPEAAKVDVTLLGYGGTSGILLEACDRLFEEHDLVAQVVCVMQVYPFDVTSILEALEGVDQLVIVEEGQGFAGFGAEVIAQIAELGTLPGLAVRRVTPPAFCIPSCGPLEKQVLPSAATIIEAALAMGKS